jgi:hypothetical protein
MRLSTLLAGIPLLCFPLAGHADVITGNLSLSANYTAAQGGPTVGTLDNPFSFTIPTSTSTQTNFSGFQSLAWVTPPTSCFGPSCYTYYNYIQITLTAQLANLALNGTPLDVSSAKILGFYGVDFGNQWHPTPDELVLWNGDDPAGYLDFTINEGSSTLDIRLFNMVEVGSSSLTLGPIWEMALIPNPSDPPASAPEPSSLALFGAGFLGLGFIRRRLG